MLLVEKARGLVTTSVRLRFSGLSTPSARFRRSLEHAACDSGFRRQLQPDTDWMRLALSPRDMTK